MGLGLGFLLEDAVEVSSPKMEAKGFLVVEKKSGGFPIIYVALGDKDVEIEAVHGNWCRSRTGNYSVWTEIGPLLTKVASVIQRK